MENNKDAAEENSSDNSARSVIAISSIYIELPLLPPPELPFPPPPKMDPTQCNDHGFSIREYSLSNRGSNQMLSSLFPSIGESYDKPLPPIVIKKHRYWDCPECVNEVIENAGTHLDTTAEISEDMQLDGSDSGIQQALVPENTEGIQSDGTDAGMLQVIVPENIEDVPAIGTDSGIHQGLIEGTSEDIQSSGTNSGIQRGSLVLSTECIQSIGANVGERNGQTALSTEGINAEENTVETSALPSNTPKITSAQHVEISHTGDKNAPIERMEDVVEITGERLKAKTGRRTIGGDAKVPTGKVKAKSGDISTRGGHKYANRKKRVTPPEKEIITSIENDPVGIPGKTDETENDSCSHKENPNGNPRRKVKKVRLLIDLLSEDNPSVKSTEINSTTSSLLLESAGSGNAALEVQVGCEKDMACLQSPRRNAKVSREGEEPSDPSNVASNVKVAEKDNGKAPMIVDIPDYDENVVPSGGEGLFIGTKSERLRRRSEITPSVSKKKNKPTDVLDLSASVSSLIQSLQASSAAGIWGSRPCAEPSDQNHAILLSAGLDSQPSFNTSEKLGLDLSLGSFSMRNHHQDSGKKAYLKDDILFGKSNVGPPAELKRSSSKGPSLDLNEEAALIPYNEEAAIIPYNPDTNKFPVHGEADFFKLGLKEKSADHENPKEIDQRADEVSVDIVEFLVKHHQHDKKSDFNAITVVQRSSDMINRYLDGQAPTTMNDLGKVYPGLYGVPPFQTPHAASMARESGRMHQRSPITLAHLSNNRISLFQTEGNRQKLSSGIQISSSASVGDGLHHPQALETLSSALSKQTFGFGIQQMEVAEHQKGKTISDIKVDELKKSEEARLIYKSGDSAIGSNAKQPLAYAYTEEVLPPMQLLSLMDGGSSGTALSLGTPKIPNKPFTPCPHHPRFSREEQQDLTNGSMFLRQSLTKEPPTSGPALLSCQSLIPYSAANQLSLYTPVKEISRNKSQNPGSSGGGGGPSSSHAKGKQKAITDVANSMVRPPTYQRYVNSNQLILEGIIAPARSGSGRQHSADGVCTTNRNPAEISHPEDKRYTICGKDLKSRKRKPYAKRTASAAGGDSNRQRTKKGRPGDERPRENPSGGK